MGEREREIEKERETVRDRKRETGARTRDRKKEGGRKKEALSAEKGNRKEEADRTDFTPISPIFADVFLSRYPRSMARSC